MACDDALIQGELVANQQSGHAIKGGGADGVVQQVAWQGGLIPRLDGATMTLLDASGGVVAREGDRVQLKGGFGLNNVWFACEVQPAPPGAPQIAPLK